MKKFENEIIDLGYLKEGKKKAFSFYTTKELDIEEVKASCGRCTKIVGFNPYEVKVLFKGETIPHHITTKTHTIVKSIKVFEDNGDLTILKYKVTLTRK